MLGATKAMKKVVRRLSLRRSASSGAVRAGFLAVYVGPDRSRFIVPTRYLNYPVFASLLEKAEEELGFQPAGGLALTCDALFFDSILDALNRDENRFKAIGLDGFVDLFASNGDEFSSSNYYYYSCNHQESAVSAAFSPLLQKARA